MSWHSFPNRLNAADSRRHLQGIAAVFNIVTGPVGNRVDRSGEMPAVCPLPGLTFLTEPL